MNKVDYLLHGMVLGLIGLMAYAVVFYTSQAGKCLADPLTFGANEYSKGSNSNLECSCVYNKSVMSPFEFNRTGISYSIQAFPQESNYSDLVFKIKP